MKKSQGIAMKGFQLSQFSLLLSGLLFPVSAQATAHIDTLDMAIIFAPFLIPISLVLHLIYRIKIRRRSWPRKQWQVTLFCVGTMFQIVLITIYAMLLFYNGVCPTSTYSAECALMLFIVSTTAVVFLLHCSSMHHVITRYRRYCLMNP
ncbi:hypothetical protein BOW35_06295 [Solemya velum gill symbiont]|nr:hypothetical protein JV46_08380 [Solemya velum gill symbiont]OOZ19610.1 hypothetical protein BOW29_05790 [Solemya velum gill symbiont]OOZ34158.1 hypothetical protein BOW35_06295 [Solemya velum gill symbiont]